MANRITKKELQAQVDSLNNTMCKNTKHKYVVSGAYGGYQVQLTGKRSKDGKGWRGALRSGNTSVTSGYQSARTTLNDLNSKVVSGEAKRQLSYWEKQKR